MSLFKAVMTFLSLQLNTILFSVPVLGLVMVTIIRFFLSVAHSMKLPVYGLRYFPQYPQNPLLPNSFEAVSIKSSGNCRAETMLSSGIVYFPANFRIIRTSPLNLMRYGTNRAESIMYSRKTDARI